MQRAKQRQLKEISNLLAAHASPMQRPCILCFVAHYLPGFRSGGPVRTIANFVEQLGGEFDMWIVTRDRDAMDPVPYGSINVDAWNRVGNANVYYASPKTTSLVQIARLLRQTPHDILYLNSFFSFQFTLLPLLARYLFVAPRVPCVIAPRGEFSAGALAIKPFRKRLYLYIAKAFGLYRGLCWQASSHFEADDIRRELGDLAELIQIAPNLPPCAQSLEISQPKFLLRHPGPLRIVFLSRISPKKNLHFLLECLYDIHSNVQLSIYGPIRDSDYWTYCQDLISNLPKNVSVSYGGEVLPMDVSDCFSGCDLFVFPTLGENYGHVVLEALSAGTSVLISEHTPWRGTGTHALEILPLDQPHAWREAIECWAELSENQLQAMRVAALARAGEYLETNEALALNRLLFSRLQE